METKGKFLSSRSAASQPSKPHTRTKKKAHNNGRKKILDEEEVNNCSETLSAMRGRGGKRSKRRKTCDAIKKRKHDDERVISLKTSPKSSQSPDTELKPDNLDSPVLEDTQESSSSSLESNEMLCMSSLLKTVLDRKKMLLLESPEILQFFKNQRIKEEEPVE